MLSSRMRISVHPEKPFRCSHTCFIFHMKYASFVFKTLRKPVFQSFLRWMLKRENIEEHAVMSVKVMTFPFKKDSGKRLAGTCNSKGEINIYPKRLKFCRKLKQKFGKEKLHSYIKTRARATLIHELLHVKYLNDEEKVRELTRKYFNILARHQKTSNPENDVSKMLFKH